MVSYRGRRPRKIKRSRGICLYDAAVSFEYHAFRVRVCLRRYRIAFSLG